MSQDEAARLGGRFAKLSAVSTTSALGSGLTTVATPLLVAAGLPVLANAGSYAASAL